MKSYIASSIFYFLYKKYIHYRRYENTSVDSDGILTRLFADGIVVIPNFITNEACGRIVSSFRSHFNDIHSGNFIKSKFHYFPDYGVTRILEADKLSNESLLFFNNEYVNNIAQKYVSKKASSYQKMIELRSGDNTKSKSDGIHFDDWKQRFKSFLYLNDVTSDNAPFRYYPGSHLGKGWRLRRLLAEYDYFLHGKSGKYGYFSRDEFSKFKHKLTFPEQVCCGSAGTLILVDTRGLHSGTPLVSGQRMMLASYFDVR